MKHYETLEHSSFDATTSALDAGTSAIARSNRQYRRGVNGDIGDCGVGITPQMCNRVTNHGDVSTFSKPARWLIQLHHLAHWSTFNTIAIKLNKVFINKSYFNSIKIKINNKQGFCHCWLTTSPLQ